MNTEKPDPVSDYLDSMEGFMNRPGAIQSLLDSVAAKARAGDPEALQWLRLYSDHFKAKGYYLPIDDIEL